MYLSALVIGYGSIGKRHAEIINSIDTVNKVTFLAPENDQVEYNVPSTASVLPLSADIYIGGTYTFTFTANADFAGIQIRYTPVSGSPVVVTLANGTINL